MFLNLSHKKLVAWQKAIELLPILYRICDKLPKDERYNLVDQMKRAGISISNNLADGASRKSKVEKSRFFEVSRSSIVEIDNCLTACVALKFLAEADLHEVGMRLVELFKMITGLIDFNYNNQNH